LHVKSENISPPFTMIAVLDGVGLWLGLFKSPDLTSTPSYRATLMPQFTCHQLNLKRILLPILLRQQQPGIFEGRYQSLLHHWLCIKVGGHALEHLL
jgi:hypothetical protein